MHRILGWIWHEIARISWFRVARFKLDFPVTLGKWYRIYVNGQFNLVILWTCKPAHNRKGILLILIKADCEWGVLWMLFLGWSQVQNLPLRLLFLNLLYALCLLCISPSLKSNKLVLLQFLWKNNFSLQKRGLQHPQNLSKSQHP